MQFFKIIAISSGLGTENTPTVNCTVAVYDNTVYRKKLSRYFFEVRQRLEPNLLCIAEAGSVFRRCVSESILDLDLDRRDGVVVRASASQSVDQGFIPLVESYQKTLKNGIRNSPAWRSAFRGSCGEQAGKFACCVLGQVT